jgi:acyl-CoA synthetase (AMP-forming)/AMP-acid ligase II
MAGERSFVSVLRANMRAYGDDRGFTFVTEEKGPGRRYHEEDLGLTELDRRARTLAVHLHGLGIRRGAVLLLYPEGLDFITAFVGCLYGQVIAVPAPFPEMDAGRAERTRRIIDDADIRWILTDSAHREMLENWLAAQGLADEVHCLATDVDIDADPDAWTMPTYEPDATAFLQYTSGSTSDPKGVVVSYGNLLRNAEEINARIEGGPHTVGIGWVPHYHDMGLVGQILHPLYMAGRYVLMSPITFIKRPVVWLEMVTRHRATIIVGPNFGYELLLRRVTDAQLADLDLSSLLIAKNGAEPVLAGTLERMAERFGPVGFRRETWMPCYGMAEVTLLISAAPIGRGPVIREFDFDALTVHKAVPARTGADGAPGSTARVRRLVSSGRPVTLDVRIVDPGTRSRLPEGRIGEIWIAGGSVARGYWRRPVETRESFEAVTTAGGTRYLRTGDLGFVLDGELYVTGRIKDLIIVNGHNIYAHDLEETSRSTHPATRTAAAFSLADPADTGREQVIIVQEVIPAAARDMGLAELASLTRDTVARSFGLPSLSVVLSGPGAVRRTTSGKIQRGLTRQAFLEGKIKQLAGDLDPAVADLGRPREQSEWSELSEVSA